MGTATVRTATPSELKHELDELQRQLDMPFVHALELRDTGVLTADQYALVARIRNLQWLLEDD